MFKTTLVALAAASLLACSAVPASAGGLDLNGLIHTAKVDLATAKADADAHNDVLASTCYGGILTYVDAHPVQQLQVGGVVGVASAFQVARDGVKTAQVGLAQGFIPVDLELACGPLALDVQNDLGKAVAGGLFSFKLF